jgi:hypothetical protein
MAQHETLDLAGIRFRREGIDEHDGGTLLAHVPWADVGALRVGYGSASLRPWLSIPLGFVLIAIAAVAASGLLMFLNYGGSYHTAGAWLIALAVPGAWLLYASRPTFVLRVSGPNGSRRLVFQGAHERDEIEAFVRAGQARFGAGS